MAAEPSIRFVQQGTEAGLHGKLVCGGPQKKWIPEANGSGCAALDYDADGHLDLLVVNGSTMERLVRIVAGEVPEVTPGGVFLYRNKGAGRFEDKTEAAGLFNPYWGTGANAADYDGDGRTDILITTIGVDLLFRNNGDGTFTETGAKAGLIRRVSWHTGSTFGDYDGDGDLDLYIAGYVDPRSMPWRGEAPACDYRGLRVFCGPIDLKGEADILYRNNGDGTYTPVTRQAGVEEREPRYGFTSVFEDFNQDGKPDIFVANDSGANYLYLNDGNGRFEESALASGLAYNSDGRPMANMGVAVGDYDNDGDLDLLTTTFSEDYFPLFAQTSPGFFEEASARAGLALPTIPYLGWACGFADFDNDGLRELWLANGHVYPTAANLSTTTYQQPFVVLANRSGRFVPAHTGPKDSYRGGVAGDFNNDGRIDAVLLPIAGTPVLMENRSGNSNQWIGLSLPDAPGTQVRLRACGKQQFATLRNGGSYLSRDDPRIHFGLGRCPEVDQVSIRWPNGKGRELRALKPGQYVTVLLN
jgi:hypothetical protein